MTVELEKALEEKCRADPRLKLLAAQWAYDKQLVGQALQTVGSTFPHYSLHDASHSNTILIQVTRLLGDRISFFSASDLWLLLESAYWHDIGMVVDESTVRKWWSDSEFKEHLMKMKKNHDPVLANAANFLNEPNLKSHNWPLEIKKSVALVISDFARGKHAGRSGEIVEHPLKMIGVKSPRILIPERLFGVLSKISAGHGKSQSWIMNNLEFSACGMGTDTCHPRLIGCLLRLGDLLDMDNGRFCPILGKTFGNLPPSSLDHVAKHASVQHFHVCPAKIEVEAICSKTDDDVESEDASDPYGAYEAMASWLDWLQEEVKFVSSRWASIAPEGFGSAPSLGTIKVSLGKEYLFLDVGKRPKFGVDEPAFLKLIRSNSLYDDRHAWLRELLSNADDATRIRVFLESKKLDSGDRFADPLESLRGEFEKFPIKLEIKKESIGEDSKQISVTIEDQGTGITQDDLRYLLLIGSSEKNWKRRRIIERMPQFLRPTGNFGIGFQSIFMVADVVRIESTDFQTRETLEITINRSSKLINQISGNSFQRSQAAGVYIKRLDNKNLSRRGGTKIEFSFPTVAVAETKGAEITITGAEEGFFDFPIKIGHENIDPVLQELENAELAQLNQLASETSLYLRTPVELNGVGIGESREDDEDVCHLFYSKPQNCLIRFKTTNLKQNDVDLKYRGMPIKRHSLCPTDLIRVSLDLQSGNASEILTASRDALTPHGTQEVQKRLDLGIAEVFPAYLNKLKQLAE